MKERSQKRFSLALTKPHKLLQPFGLDAASRSEALGSALSARSRFLMLSGNAEGSRFCWAAGSHPGKSGHEHGEIEQGHVGVKRAFDALQGQAPSATEGVLRSTRRLHRQYRRSRSINGIRTPSIMSSDTEKYPISAQSDGIYNIPFDQADQLDELRRTGAIEGLSEKSARTIQRKLDEIQAGTGRSPESIIKPEKLPTGKSRKARSTRPS